MNYYEGNDYLLIGVEYGGTLAKRGGSGTLFNGRFTSCMETNLMGEHNILLEINDTDRSVMYRYPIGGEGEPILSLEVKDVRCPNK